MKPRLIQPRPFAFTLLELLVLIAIICILAAMLLPAGSDKKRALRIVCLYNQKQIAAGLTLFSTDHQNAFPANISVTNGGAMESLLTADVGPFYGTLTNYTVSLYLLRCRTDRTRSDALPGEPITRTNVSYFISLDAWPTNTPTYTILTGDRHLILNSKPVGPGLFTLTTNQALEWSTELHSANKKPTGGNFSFADGHAEWVSVKSLSQVIARQNMAANRVAVP